MTITPDPSEQLLQGAADGDLAVVEQAIADGAELEHRDDEQRTALLLAVHGGHLDVARALVEAGASPDAVDAEYDTPWLATGVTGSVEMATVLLEGNPDQTKKNRFGGISVIPAAERGHVDYVRFVVDVPGVDVNHVNNLGWTALLEAVILGDGGAAHQEVVRILLDAGADPSIADREGVTALEHARKAGHSEIAELLA